MYWRGKSCGRGPIGVGVGSDGAVVGTLTAGANGEVLPLLSVCVAGICRPGCAAGPSAWLNSPLLPAVVAPTKSLPSSPVSANTSTRQNTQALPLTVVVVTGPSCGGATPLLPPLTSWMPALRLSLILLARIRFPAPP